MSPPSKAQRGLLFKMKSGGWAVRGDLDSLGHGTGRRYRLVPSAAPEAVGLPVRHNTVTGLLKRGLARERYGYPYSWVELQPDGRALMESLEIQGVTGVA